MSDASRQFQVNPGLLHYVEDEQRRAYEKLDVAERIDRNANQLFSTTTSDGLAQRVIDAHYWDQSKAVRKAVVERFRQDAEDRERLSSPFTLQNKHYLHHVQRYVEFIRRYAPMCRLARVDAPTLATLPFPQFNAFTARHPHYDGSVIVFNEALLTFLFLLSKIVARYFPAAYVKNAGFYIYFERNTVNQIFNSDVKAKELFERLINGLIYRGDPLRETDPYLLPRANNFVAGNLVAFSELFVFAHELAHVALGHLERDENHPAGFGSELGAVDTALADEFAADAEALECVRLCTEGLFSKIPDKAERFHTTYWAAELVFKGMELTEKAITLAKFGFEGLIRDDYHPPVKERRQALRRIVQSQFKGDNRVLKCPNWEVVVYPADWTNRIVDALWEGLKPKIKERRVSGTQVSPRWDSLTEDRIAPICA